MMYVLFLRRLALQYQIKPVFSRHKPAIAFNEEKYRPINVQQPTDIKIENEFLR